ncbi:hypothetical protein EYR40_000271 [Pleurotus pulmonarius]|nr:hypothetical protein EYR40_000271 [Pleurotus pulmonarius]
MGRWTQYDEDSYRLPPGVKRTAYDADTGVYTYRDGNGQIYTGAPHQRYGTLRPISQPPAETRAMFDKDKAPLSVDTKSPGPAPKSFADILSPDQVTSAPPIHGGRSPTKPTSPKSRFIDAVRRATAPKMLDVVHNATTSVGEGQGPIDEVCYQRRPSVGAVGTISDDCLHPSKGCYERRSSILATGFWVG